MAAYGAKYVHTIMPLLLLEMVNYAFMIFYMSQRIVLIALASILAGCIMHASMIGILVYGLDLGYDGVVWATASMTFAKSIATFTFVRLDKKVKWFDDVRFFSKETVTNLGPIVKLCIMSMLMGIWGWWAFDIFTFMATYLGETEAAAQSILRSLGLLTFMLPVGYSTASGILIGNSIGASKPREAMTYYIVCMMLACLITVLQMSILWLAQDSFIGMFTNNAAIAEIMVYSWPVLILFTFFDTTQAMGNAFIKASGKQGFGALITGSAYFALGIPCAYYFAFVKDLSNRGLWWGATLAVAYNTLWYNIIIFRIDWYGLIKGIREREAEEKRIRLEL